MIESVRVRELPTWWEFVQHLIHTPSYRWWGANIFWAQNIFLVLIKNIVPDMTGTGGRTRCSALCASCRTTSSSTSRTSSRRRSGWPQSSGRRMSSRPGQDTRIVLTDTDPYFNNICPCWIFFFFCETLNLIIQRQYMMKS